MIKINKREIKDQWHMNPKDTNKERNTVWNFEFLTALLLRIRVLGFDAVSGEWFVLSDGTVVLLYSRVNMFMISAMDLLTLENEDTVSLW